MYRSNSSVMDDELIANHSALTLQCWDGQNRVQYTEDSNDVLAHCIQPAIGYYMNNTIQQTLVALKFRPVVTQQTTRLNANVRNCRPISLQYTCVVSHEKIPTRHRPPQSLPHWAYSPIGLPAHQRMGSHSQTCRRRSVRLRLKFHLARLDSTRRVRLCRASRASRDERVERDELCSSNMADDERSCTSLVVFMLLHTQILFVSSNKIN